MVALHAFVGLLTPGPPLGRELPVLRVLWVAPVVLLAETGAIYLLPASILPYALPVAHILLLPFLLLNLRFIGVRLILAGLILNLLAMVANGGLMPVEMRAVEAVGKHDGQELVIGDHIDGSKNVLLAREDVRLRGLTDVILLPVPQPFTRAISLGDIAIVVGVAVVGASLARPILRKLR